MHNNFFLEQYVKLLIRPREQNLEDQAGESKKNFVSIELWCANEETFSIKLDIPVGWRYCVSPDRRPDLKHTVEVSKKEAFPRACKYKTWFGFYPPTKKDETSKKAKQVEILVQVVELAQLTSGTKVWVAEEIPNSWEAVRDTQAIPPKPSRCT